MFKELSSKIPILENSLQKLQTNSSTNVYRQSCHLSWLQAIPESGAPSLRNSKSMEISINSMKPFLI